MKTCPNCHFNNESNTQFCVECGTNIKDVSENTSAVNISEVRFWNANQNIITCDEYFVSGKLKEKKFIIFENKEEFYFPLKNISSVRYVSGANISLIKIIFALALLGCGIYFLFLIRYSKTGTNFIGIASLILGGIIAFSLFKKVNQIIIKTANDKETVVMKEFSKNSKLQQFVDTVNSQIARNNYK